jgi:hypothetical protein
MRRVVLIGGMAANKGRSMTKWSHRDEIKPLIRFRVEGVRFPFFIITYLILVITYP